MDRLPEYPQRQRLRLAGYDYASAGYYFITVCTHGRACLFGSVVAGRMELSAAGEMARTVWEEMPAHYPGVGIDAMVVLPNHLHGIVVLVGDSDREDGRHDPQRDSGAALRPAVGKSAPPRSITAHERRAETTSPSLVEVMQRFKSLTTMRYGIGVRQDGWPAYAGKLWQRSYHERVIRNERELAAVRLYMEENAQQWGLDRENPEYAGR